MGLAASGEAGRDVTADCQSGRAEPAPPDVEADGAAPEPGRRWWAALYRALAPVMGVVLRFYFGRIRIRGRADAARGAALVVANHPCTWVDAAVLDVALGRRLHFFADHHLFRPRARAWFLRIFGTLPVSIDDRDPEHEALNAETFARSERLLRRGEAVAIFPEGASVVDRGLLPLHPGAARLALGYRPPPGARRLALVPVSLHYGDRASVRSGVTVTVDAPLPLDDPAFAPGAPAVARLTARIDQALRAGIVDLDPCGGVDAAILEPLAARGVELPSLEASQALAAALGSLARRSPARHRALLGLARAYARARRVLGVGDGALAGRAPGKNRARAVEVALVGGLALAAAAVGRPLHAPPRALIDAATRHYARHPSHVALVRITAAAALLPPWYLALALAVSLATRSAALGVASAALALATGLVAWWAPSAARTWMERARLARLARRHPGLVARARAMRRALGREVADLIGREGA